MWHHAAAVLLQFHKALGYECEVSAAPARRRRRAAHLDEGAGHQEAMGQANLHAALHRRHAGAVRGQRAQVADNQGRAGHGRLQAAHERVTVDGLDNLGLQGVNAA